MRKDQALKTGIDVGSTTVKVVVVGNDREQLYGSYQRHNVDIVGTLVGMINQVMENLGDIEVDLAITGSAGMGLSERLNIPFIQEVIATAEAVRIFHPDCRTLIDVGGEDSKMIFFDERLRPDIRMNGNCAGGTGAFIDQMAALMDVSLETLGSLATRYGKIVPIASRCAVFAKTDVQNLIARETPKEDIAASIFNAVVIQVLSGLSQGRSPEPGLIFAGGPLKFFPILRQLFLQHMGYTEQDVIPVSRPDLLPALGTAVTADDHVRIVLSLSKFKALIETKAKGRVIQGRLSPLFSSREDFQQWSADRMTSVGRNIPLEKVDGKPTFLGIDSGSTTTKVVLIDEHGDIAYSFYSSNHGDSIGTVVTSLRELEQMAKDKNVHLHIAHSASTGYGEDLIRAAFGLDIGMVETVAHAVAAREFLPDVSFILDIGGQDMKAIFIREGLIHNIEINEACSSGCGSFIETFAESLNYDIEEFARMACRGQQPVDLGIRCTVFMNSSVKQSLREGASVEDISAGLAVSVIKNCLYKVLQIRDASVLGDRIVVQGGTFRNPAIHRALETLLGRRVVCPDIPELMGAYGSALIARDDGRRESSFIGFDKLEQTTNYERRIFHCHGCENQCEVTRILFPQGKTFFTGNRCERFFSNSGEKIEPGEDVSEFMLQLLFDNLPEPEHPIATIGIPRILNMYSRFPFWSTLLTRAGIRVVLSSPSSEKIYEMGARTVMADNICFPARIAHGHIFDLAEKGVDRIFYPIVRYEEADLPGSMDTYNCPIVTGYPDVLNNAIDSMDRWGISLDRPHISFHDPALLKTACWDYLKTLGVTRHIFNRAFAEANSAHQRFREQYQQRTDLVIEHAEKHDHLTVLLLGRPYHLDPYLNHRIPALLSQQGVDVVTAEGIRPQPGWSDDVQVLTQWVNPNHIFNAVRWAVFHDNVEVVQINSFGCGPDAVIADEIKQILAAYGKSYTLIRVDESSSPGSIKLRIRSMVASARIRTRQQRKKRTIRQAGRPFLQSDTSRTIIVPNFSRFYSPILESFMQIMGHNVMTLPESDRESVRLGLQYTNNDICYPAIIVVGDVIKALQTGRYPRERTAVGITHSGGQCRYSCYASMIQKGLISAGYEDIPVISAGFNDRTTVKQPGFRLQMPKVLEIGVPGILFADAIKEMYLATACREQEAGTAKSLMDEYHERAKKIILRNGTGKNMLTLLHDAVNDFNRVSIEEEPIPVVGLLGEIYTKYNCFGSMHIADRLASEGIEVVIPPIFDFFAQNVLSPKIGRAENVQSCNLQCLLSYPAEWVVEWYAQRFYKVLQNYRFHRPPVRIATVARKANTVLNLVNQYGEGWLVPGEISVLAEQGINQVLVLQPFGCIANHVVAKGTQRALTKLYPDLHILNLDIDASSSEVNVYNRLRFLIKAAEDDVERRREYSFAER
ncbi:2-hydroxyacyl-CoA dehydratase [bacterium]|nr:2-hydroxyacyl-CoA dehydratase [candidate division CSSED10-310 bacterium]